MDIIKPIKVFICYAMEDYNVAKRLYNDLKNLGLKPWLDKEDILIGQNWKFAINQAIQKSDYFLALISRNSLSKKGYVHKEMKIAFEVLDNYPTSQIFLLPVLLEKCEPFDENLQNIQWGKLYPSYKTGFYEILRVFKINKNNDIFQNIPKFKDLSDADQTYIYKVIGDYSINDLLEKNEAKTKVPTTTHKIDEAKTKVPTTTHKIDEAKTKVPTTTHKIDNDILLSILGYERKKNPFVKFMEKIKFKLEDVYFYFFGGSRILRALKKLEKD